MTGIEENILVVAAHADDETLGCGGSIARWASEGRSVHLLILADGESSRGDRPGLSDKIVKRRSAMQSVAGILGLASTTMLEFPDNRMDGAELLDVVKKIESAVEAVKPACVLTHHSGDVNIDHRITHDAVLAACRPQPGFCVKQLLFFEVASSTEWRPSGSGQNFVPNYFVDVSETLSTKLRAMDVYSDEMRDFPHPRSPQAIEALARWRGASCGVLAAEAFMLGRLVI